MIESLPRFSSDLAITLLRFVWQGALIGLVAAFLLALLRNARPQARYAVCCAALLCCAALPAWQFASLSDHAENPASLPAVPASGDLQGVLTYSLNIDASPALPTPSGEALAWVAVLWALGAGLLSLRMAGGLWWVYRLRARASSAGAAEWAHVQSLIDGLALRLRVTRPVALQVTTEGTSPVSAGWLRPAVLLPASLALNMPVPLLEALLAHELAHIRRHDYLINLVQSVIEIVLFYHPVVWWLSRRIREEREQVADQLAAEALGDPRRLATALLELESDSFVGAAIAQSAHGGHLMTRIQQLLRPSCRSVAGATVMPALGLGLASFALYAHAHLIAGDLSDNQEAAIPAVAPITPLPPVAAVSPLAPLPALPTVPATPASIPRLRTGSLSASVAAIPAVPAVTAAPVLPPIQVAMAAPPTQISVLERDEESFGLVRKDRSGVLMSGQLADADTIRSLKEVIPGDFIWYRRHGRSYVIRDAATLARAGEIWRPSDELDRQMRALERRMQPHQQKLEAIRARMEKFQDFKPQDEVIRNASAELQVLAEKQRDLAMGRMKLELASAQVGAEKQGDIRYDISKLDDEQRKLDALMERQSRLIDSETGRLEKNEAPMRELEREMALATAPMQDIGKDMAALGQQIEKTSATAKIQMKQLIDQAEKLGLALGT